MNKIKGLLQSITEDDIYLSRSKTQWNSEDDLSKKCYNEFFPHLSNFEVSMPSFFLYELNDFDYLNYFPIALIRDGVLSLAKFFHLNPEPKHIKTMFVINSRLSFLVPELWLEQVAFYEMGSSPPKDKVESDNADVYISLLGSRLFCDLDYVKEVSQKILKDSKGKSINLTIVANNNNPAGEKSSRTKVNNYIYYAIDVIRSVLTNVKRIEYINTSDIEYYNLENSLFYDLNQFNTLFSDCYVSHNIMSKGAFKMCSVPTLDKSFFHAISFFHGYYISSQAPAHYKAQRKGYLESLRPIQSFLNENEMNLQRSASDPNSLRIVSPEFESLLCDYLRTL